MRDTGFEVATPIAFEERCGLLSERSSFIIAREATDTALWALAERDRAYRAAMINSADRRKFVKAIARRVSIMLSRGEFPRFMNKPLDACNVQSTADIISG